MMPQVSIIILYLNRPEHLRHCLNCLNLQAFRNFELIIVDNGSKDNQIDDLPKLYKNLSIDINKQGKNIGFAAANNLGARLARGKWLALLNTDAFPESDWLEKLVQTAEGNPKFVSFSSCQIQVNSPELLDGAGDAYHTTGLAWRRYYNKLVKEYGQRTEEVFSACPAAALYSREEFLKMGGFDEDYFSYFEDVDLGFRLRLGGAKCLYVPEAVVHHVGSASTGKRSDFSVYYGYRNMIWTFVKNMPAPLIWIFLPFHIAAVLFFAVYLTIRGQGKVIWRAIFDAICGLPKMIGKRKTIQKNKKIEWTELLKVMSTGLFEPLQEFMYRNNRK